MLALLSGLQSSSRVTFFLNYHILLFFFLNFIFIFSCKTGQGCRDVARRAVMLVFNEPLPDPPYVKQLTHHVLYSWDGYPGTSL